MSDAAYAAPGKGGSGVRAFGKAVLVGGLAAGLIWGGAAQARTLDVGPAQQYKAPSAAVAAAENGDTIRVAPGQYFDCAVIHQDNLTIEGTGPGAVMTDKTCGGKALLVIDGSDVTVRNLTLQRARVPDNNGAGIRAEGGNLTIENTRFLNNQDGILAADNPDATIRIVGSEFDDNGRCQGACAHAIYIGHIRALDVENTRIFDTHEGHAIKSRALRTSVTGCDIEDGPNGTSSYVVDIPNGGTLIVENNKIEKGPHTNNWGNAIIIGEEGVTQPTEQIVVRGNQFRNDTGHSTTFVNNITATPAELSQNVFHGQVRPLQGDGSQR